METLMDIFVRSIFTENLIFAYFLGMCSYLAVSKTVKTATDWVWPYFCVAHYLTCQLPAAQIRIGTGSPGTDTSEVGRCRSQFSEFHLVYCCHSRYRTIG